MSAQLQRLEQMLGRVLFTRGDDGVAPTEAGLSVVDQARDILARVEVLSRQSAEPSGVDTLMLRLGATMTPVLPGVLAKLSHAHPEVIVTVKSEYAIGALLTMLETDCLDAALVLDYPGQELPDTPTVACRAFSYEPAFVALPSSHPLADRVEVPLRDLAGEAWFVTPDDGAGWPGVFSEACTQAGFSPLRTHEFLDHRNLPTLIASGVGITVCQPTTKTAYGMVVRPLAGSPIRYRQLLAWRRDSPAARLASAMHQFASDTHRALIAETPHYDAWMRRHMQA